MKRFIYVIPAALLVLIAGPYPAQAFQSGAGDANYHQTAKPKTSTPAKAAEPVYRLLGKEGLPAESFPAINQPVFGQIGYHVRAGRHDVTEFDWTQYLRFFDEKMR